METAAAEAQEGESVVHWVLLRSTLFLMLRCHQCVEVKEEASCKPTFGRDPEVEKDTRCRLWLIREIPGRTFLFSFSCSFIQATPRKPIMAVKPLMSPITPPALLSFNSSFRHIARIRGGFVTLSDYRRPHTAPVFRCPAAPNVQRDFDGLRPLTSILEKSCSNRAGKKLAVCLEGLMSTRLSRDVTAHCIYQIPKENVSTDFIKHIALVPSGPV